MSFYLGRVTEEGYIPNQLGKQYSGHFLNGNGGLRGSAFQIYKSAMVECGFQTSSYKSVRTIGKQTMNPTLRWVFQCFMAVHLVTIEGVKQVINFTDERRHILKFFSPACQSYYLLLEPDP